MPAKSSLNLAVVDFETYWDKDFSLRSKTLNMSEYVRDERFFAHMVGIKYNDGPVRVYPPDEIEGALGQIDWSKTALGGHNLPFDGFILSEHYDVIPAFYYDTLAMARGFFSTNHALDLDSVAKYCGFEGKVQGYLDNTKGVLDLSPELYTQLEGGCARDVEQTYAVLQHFLEQGYPEAELDLIDLTIRMFTMPVLRVDLPRVQLALEAEIGKKVGAILLAGATAEQLMSNQKFATLLEARNIIPPTKISPRTGLKTFAFAKNDHGMMYLRTHPGVKDLIEARLAVKSTIGETRAGRLLKNGDDPLPVLLNYCGAHTTRWSAGNKMNMQNLPRGGELRKSLMAPDGYAIIVADSAQIEARVLAWLAGHTMLLALFRNKQDVYRWQAARVYTKELEDITKEERFVGKVLTLGLGYGMGPDKLQAELAKGMLGAPPLKIPGSQAEFWVNTYRANNKPVVDLWETMKQVINRMMAIGIPPMHLGPLEIDHERIYLPSGLALHYPHLKWTRAVNEVKQELTYQSRTTRSRIYGGLLTENVVQALARCVVADQMLEIAQRYRVVTMSHDEIVAIAPIRDADDALEDMITAMRVPPKWAPSLPLDAEGSWDVNYSK